MSGETFGNNSSANDRNFFANAQPAASQKPKTPFMKKVKRILTAILLIAIALGVLWVVHTCNSYKAAQAEIERHEAQRDSMITAIVRSHSRLYTAETTSKKTVTYTSDNKVNLKFAGIEKAIKLPFGKTEASIPVSVTYKAYIDMDKVTRADIVVDADSAILITLPDPVIVETAVAVDHDKETMKKEWLAKALTYEEYQKLVRQAKDEAWQELSEDDQEAIVERAKLSATELLIPQLRKLGFTSITIDYREDFSILEIVREKLKR